VVVTVISVALASLDRDFEIVIDITRDAVRDAGSNEKDFVRDMPKPTSRDCETVRVMLNEVDGEVLSVVEAVSSPDDEAEASLSVAVTVLISDRVLVGDCDDDRVTWAVGERRWRVVDDDTFVLFVALPSVESERLLVCSAVLSSVTLTWLTDGVLRDPDSVWDGVASLEFLCTMEIVSVCETKCETERYDVGDRVPLGDARFLVGDLEVDAASDVVWVLVASLPEDDFEKVVDTRTVTVSVSELVAEGSEWLINEELVTVAVCEMVAVADASPVLELPVIEYDLLTL
jgi:hypothetical protein